MSIPVLVVGHRNPDNDSIASAVAYAHLKNQLELRFTAEGEEPKYEYIPARLGPCPSESEWVLEKNGFMLPKRIGHVSARVRDVMTTCPLGVFDDATVLEAGKRLRRYNVRSLVVLNQDETYKGLVTTRMIAERYIAATDMMTEGGASEVAVAADLIDSLEQSVCDIMETDVTILDKNALLKDAVEDLMESSLREAVVLDDNDHVIGIVTRSDLVLKPHRKVILVDHNEVLQAAPGIGEAEVMEIVDHHRIADVSTANPIQFLNMPWGSTATIIANEYRKYAVEVTPQMAEVMLSAILTDTVILKSPTATDMDVQMVDYLAGIAGVDPTEFGIQLFRTRGSVEDLPVDKLVGADAKEFQLDERTVLIAQRETVELDAVLSREAEIRDYMRRLREDHGYEFVLLMVTDIVKEGSQILCEGNHRVVNRVFGVECTAEGGVWMPGVLSRKKQVAARILG